MKFNIRKLQFQFYVPDTAMACLMLFFGSARLYLIALLSSAFHETGHLIAMYICGNAPKLIVIHPFGAKIQTDTIADTSYHDDMLIAALGPVFSFLLFIIFFVLSKWINSDLFFQIAHINFFLFSFNLLPAKPLDGERILKSMLYQREYEKSGVLFERAAFFSVILVEIIYAVSAAYSHLNISVILFGMYILYRMIRDL